ncbi:protein RRC1 isoform X2 [Physcomitrium patens]|uniref:protein RRC1 isoform X2 n=1 Tax=Physcomitrium patens TaxID=3218 RepID=UPI000D15EE95|nr:protein RRC1-like isoform X2 [Physcomitrium patens]|eukprot:XP_024363566.1 protein RRC1-like isoform X2 [Physcomitrella patens]
MTSRGDAENGKAADKMAAFSVVRKKTPFQKHREEEDAKKRRADEEAARLYEEFVESFKADDAPGGKAFVRGGTINPDAKLPSSEVASPMALIKQEYSTPTSAASKKPGSRYVPSFIPPGLAAMVNRDKDSEKRRDEEQPKDRDRGTSRNIHHFMEELKREQEARDTRTAERENRRNDRRSQSSGIADQMIMGLDDAGDLDDKFGSFDEGDPQTTNLYVGNLAPQVDENFLLRTFGRFGPIASVKIMWPRTDEERRRQRNCGFVAFMNRNEAQAAKDEMQGIIVYDYELRIGWGKSVSLPAQALPAPPPGQMAVRAKEGATASTVAWSGPGGPSISSVSGQNAELVVTPNVPDIQVVPPKDQHLRHVIDTTAMYVLDDGCTFEQAIMERGRGKPLFSFLFDLTSSEHTYYLWRLYSFAQGDTLQRWRTEPFIMITGSGRWMPPALPIQDYNKSPKRENTTATTFAAGRGRRIDHERALTDSQRDEFEDVLRALTLERSQIREAMGFALDNAEAAGEVVEVLTESLTLKETPIPSKVARLMLVSDVLHNSSAPVKNASAYRTLFESRLPDIMESFNDLYRNITGRITAEALKERVLKVLQVWADWFLFSDSFVTGLRATFLRPGNSGVPPFHTLCGDNLPSKENGSGSEMRDAGGYFPEGSGGVADPDAALAMGEGAAARELASLPQAELERRCKHNGLSIRGGIEVMVARLLSLEEAEKQKNREQEEEIRAAQGYLKPNTATAKESSDSVARVRGEEGRGAWTDLGSKWREVSRFEKLSRNAHDNADQTGSTGNQNPAAHPRSHSETDDVRSKDSSKHSGATPSVAPPTISLIPMTGQKVFGEKAEPVLPASKWTREDGCSDNEDKDSKGLGLGYSSDGSEDVFKTDTKEDKLEYVVADSSMDEERRQKLRKLEVAIIEYRESLEERGIKNHVEIETRVALQRKKLEADYGLLDNNALPSWERDSKGLDSGLDRGYSGASDRASGDRKDRRDNRRDDRRDSRDSRSSKKRTRTHSRSRSRSLPRVKERVPRERERDRDRDRDSDSDRGRDREERDRDRYSSKDREDRDRRKDRDRDRSGRERDRVNREREKRRHA